MRNHVSFGAVIAGSLIACVVPAKARYIELHAESSQNYIKADYKMESEQLFGQIKALYFAVGCKVVPDEASLTPYIHSVSQAFEARAHESGIHPNETVQMKQAAREGIARAKEPGACAFWHRHPEMVKAIHKVAKPSH